MQLVGLKDRQDVNVQMENWLIYISQCVHDILSKTIHFDGFAVQRKKLWVASLRAVAVASI